MSPVNIQQQTFFKMYNHLIFNSIWIFGTQDPENATKLKFKIFFRHDFISAALADMHVFVLQTHLYNVHNLWSWYVERT